MNMNLLQAQLSKVDLEYFFLRNCTVGRKRTFRTIFIIKTRSGLGRLILKAVVISDPLFTLTIIPFNRMK